VAFNNLEKHGLDASDMRIWASSNCASALLEELNLQKNKALKDLIKQGEKKHNENAQRYEVYNKVISLIEEASSLK